MGWGNENLFAGSRSHDQDGHHAHINVNGIARKTGEINAAVTELINNSVSGDLTICPRVVSLKSPGKTVRVPVRVCN